MINYFIRCRDAELRNRICILSEKRGAEFALNIVFSDLGIEIKGNAVAKANSLVQNTGLFFVTYTKNYIRGDIGVSQCGIQIMTEEGRS